MKTQKLEGSKENRAAYQERMISRSIPIRFKVEELALLDKMRDDEGFATRTRFIRWKIFGFRPEKKEKQLVKEGDKGYISHLMSERLLDLARLYTMVVKRYTEDMAKLNRREEVDVKVWIDKTLMWHRYLIQEMDMVLREMNTVMDALGFEIGWESPEDTGWPEGIPSEFSLEDLKKMDDAAKRERLERIARGHGTEY